MCFPGEWRVVRQNAVNDSHIAFKIIKIMKEERKQETRGHANRPHILAFWQTMHIKFSSHAPYSKLCELFACIERS